MHSRIAGTGSALPTQRVSNHDLVAMLAANNIETSDEWIVSRSGISFRHYADANEKTSDLAAAAALSALKAANLRPDDIDVIIVATSTPDHYGGFPSTACVVQNKLGMANGCAAFDIQAVCTGFVYALEMGDALIRSGAYRRALVIGAETFSRILDFNDRSTCVLFGDGAGAVVLAQSDMPGVAAVRLHADGKFAEILKLPARIENGSVKGNAFLYMEGSTVFKLGVKAMAEVVVETLESAATPVSDLDWLVLHQANIRILNAVADYISLPREKLIVTLHEHGNTSAASIPLALDTAARDGRLQAGQKIALAAVGGGLTWGAALLEL